MTQPEDQNHQEWAGWEGIIPPGSDTGKAAGSPFAAPRPR